MKEANPIAFGNRVRERRKDLGMSQETLADRSGYSQTNVGWIEKGQAKRPHIQAEALAEALWTTSDWLLWEKGPKESGPPILTPEEAKQTYDLLSVEDRAAFSAAMLKAVEAAKQKRKSS
jgi:transcriptional regulator with XRE-family HTH domain